MKNKYVVGALLLVLGLLIAIGPQKIFPVCEFNPEKAMKCHWMGRAEIGVGAVVALIGVLQMVMDHAKVRMGLSMAAVPMGLLTLLLPTKLIGVCRTALDKAEQQVVKLMKGPDGEPIESSFASEETV